MISNLVRESKVVIVNGIEFTLRKWPKRFGDWLKARLIETGEYSADAFGPGQPGWVNLRPMNRPFEMIEEEALEKVFQGVGSWGLMQETEVPLPLTRHAVRELYVGFPNAFTELLAEVVLFNAGPTASEGESSPSTSRT